MTFNRSVLLAVDPTINWGFCGGKKIKIEATIHRFMKSILLSLLSTKSTTFQVACWEEVTRNLLRTRSDLQCPSVSPVLLDSFLPSKLHPGGSTRWWRASARLSSRRSHSCRGIWHASSSSTPSRPSARPAVLTCVDSDYKEELRLSVLEALALHLQNASMYEDTSACIYQY